MSTIEADNEIGIPIFNYHHNPAVERIANEFMHTAAKMNALQAIDRAKEGELESIRADNATIRADLEEITSGLAHLDRQLHQMPKRPADADKRISEEQQKKAKLIARRQRNAMRTEAIQRDISNPYTSCIIWMQDNQDKIFGDGRKFVDVPKGQTAKQMFESTCAQIISVQARKLEVIRAPLPIEHVKENARRQLMPLMAKGEPDVRRSFNPRRSAQGRDVIDSIKFVQKHDGSGHGVIDIESLFFWSNGDQLLAQLFAKIDAEYVEIGIAAMSAEERKAALAAVDAEIFELDRIAEAYLDLAAEDGVTGLVRRPNASPMAILGLAIAEGERS
jgi:hypothetical protein